MQRNNEVKVRFSDEEFAKLEKIADKLKMSKAKLIRNVVLGDLNDINLLHNVGILPLIQNIKAFHQKNFGDGGNFWEELKKD